MRRHSLVMLLVVGLLITSAVSCAFRLQATPTPAAPPSTPPAELITQAREFVDLLAREDYATAARMFNATMANAFPLNKLQETWKAVIAQVGAFKRQGDTRIEKSGQFDVVFVACEFEQMTLDVKVVFNAARQISGLWFTPHQAAVEYLPPAYTRADAFQEKEVQVGTGNLALPGTLSMPEGRGPFPALVLVHGSGPNDRDETVGANKPFRDLAWGLASRGIAVLRYDKRTKAHPEQVASLKNTFTVKEEVVDDVLAAVALLRKTAGIDPKRVFVLGHSLGGTLIPRLAQAEAEIAGFIILAGATRPLEDLVLYQTTYLASLDGSLSDSDKAELEGLEKQVERVKDPNLSATANPDEVLLGAPVSYWLDLRGYHPAEVAADIEQPMLILQGERDYQVTLEDFEGWKKGLSSRHNVEFKLYPKLNHLFIAGEGPSSPAEYEVPGHVAEEVISDIAAWIGKH